MRGATTRTSTSWSAEARDRILAEGGLACVCSNLTVASRWRGAVAGLSVKELLLGLSVERFLASDADVMLGTPRNDRNMNGLGYRLGATPPSSRAR